LRKEKHIYFPLEQKGSIAASSYKHCHNLTIIEAINRVFKALQKSSLNFKMVN